MGSKCLRHLIPTVFLASGGHAEQEGATHCGGGHHGGPAVTVSAHAAYVPSLFSKFEHDTNTQHYIQQ